MWTIFYWKPGAFIYTGGQQTMACGLNSVLSLRVKKGFCIFIWLGKKLKRIIF